MGVSRQGQGEMLVVAQPDASPIGMVEDTNVP